MSHKFWAEASQIETGSVTFTKFWVPISQLFPSLRSKFWANRFNAALYHNPLSVYAECLCHNSKPRCTLVLGFWIICKAPTFISWNYRFQKFWVNFDHFHHIVCGYNSLVTLKRCIVIGLQQLLTKYWGHTGWPPPIRKLSTKASLHRDRQQNFLALIRILVA